MGMASRFLARGGVPHLRMQRLAKCFRLDSAPKLAWHVGDGAVHRRGVAIDGPPTGIYAFTAMQCFDYRDGGLGRLWLEKFGADVNKQLSVGKGTCFGTMPCPPLGPQS
jgi:hypothetical protein